MSKFSFLQQKLASFLAIKKYDDTKILPLQGHANDELANPHIGYGPALVILNYTLAIPTTSNQ